MGQRTSTSTLPTTHPSLQQMDEELGCTEATSFYNGWTECADVLRERDEDNIAAMSDELDSFLEFSGIFSAVITLFVGTSSTSLQPDTSQLAVDVLLAISQQLADPAGTPALTAPPPFESASFDVVLNALLNAGLLCSLIASGMSLWVKQWLREYTLDEPAPPRARTRVRLFRHHGLRAWRMRAVVACISILLQLSVLLFSTGVVMLAHKMNETLAWVLGGLNAGWWAVTWGSALCPTFSACSPFKSPLARVLSRAAYHVRRRVWEPLGLGPACVGKSDVGRFRTLEKRELAVTGRRPERDRLELEALAFANRELWGSERLKVINECFGEVGDARMALARIEEVLMAHCGMRMKNLRGHSGRDTFVAWAKRRGGLLAQTQDGGVRQLMRIWCEVYESGQAELGKEEARAASETHALFEAVLKSDLKNGEPPQELPAATVREGCQEDIVGEKFKLKTKTKVTVLESCTGRYGLVV